MLCLRNVIVSHLAIVFMLYVLLDSIYQYTDSKVIVGKVLGTIISLYFVISELVCRKPAEIAIPTLQNNKRSRSVARATRSPQRNLLPRPDLIARPRPSERARFYRVSSVALPQSSEILNSGC